VARCVFALCIAKEGFVQLSKQTYAEYLEERYGIDGNGPLTDFVSRRDGRLLLGDRVDLNALAERYGAPLEVAFLPQIGAQVQRMEAWAEQARAETGYAGEFVYAYATKANFAAEVVRTALEAGAHYETSATADAFIARNLFRAGVLPADRLVFCNGSKEPSYLEAIIALRSEGCELVTPILDDLDELEVLSASALPLQFGVRERAPHRAHPGNNRFGLSQAEIALAAERLAGGPHRLAVYHAMAGSQIENLEAWLDALTLSLEAYCSLRRRVPTLRYFNFGGGMPTSAYDLGFRFDYPGFMRRLMERVQQVCARFDVPVPDLVGEFGRYTVASHSVYLFEVGQVKRGEAGTPDWFLINGSLMVSLPDSVLVDGQQFVVLPLDGWDAPAQEARLAGRRTCDSDDFYPRPGDAPLTLPSATRGSVVAIFGAGAYQQMISGRGGAHHCLSPEPRRILIEERDGALVVHDQPAQSLATINRLLGYAPAPRRVPAPSPVAARSRATAPSRASLRLAAPRRFSRGQRRAA
jgi:arginine decarboxylase